MYGWWTKSGKHQFVFCGVIKMFKHPKWNSPINHPLYETLTPDLTLEHCNFLHVIFIYFACIYHERPTLSGSPVRTSTCSLYLDLPSSHLGWKLPESPCLSEIHSHWWSHLRYRRNQGRLGMMPETSGKIWWQLWMFARFCICILVYHM